ncbi:MAG: aminotransferase class I/II-fold pyridoxal phosphate-dependent enzyme [Akkermansiaceae bacterium]
MPMRSPEEELTALEASSLRRQLPAIDRQLKNFSSNDYLGLSKHPSIKKAYQDAIEHYGVGSTASRLVCGSIAPHQELEALIAAAKGTEAAVSFSSGYATALGTIPAVLKKGDTVILDKLCHASLIDGARMSHATIRVFPHNNLKKLESLLASNQATSDSRTLVITEAVFSMDGDQAPLLELVQLCKKYHALVMVDEAHALGILGKTGMGLCEHLGIQDQVDFQMGTLGKAAGVAGGYIAASRVWIELLVNKARSFIYSTAPPPGQAAAACQALRIISGDEGTELRHKLWQNLEYFHSQLATEQRASSAIVPWIVGESSTALALSQKMRLQGFLLPAIRFPTVPKNTARLRITISANNTLEELSELLSCLQQA